MKRSPEQKKAFARQCLEIEKQGGDVLGYIEKNWPSYTPRACWYNLQKQYLGRHTNQLTEGKAISPEEERMMNLKRDKSAQLDAVLQLIEEKKDPILYLAEIGYRVPTQAWADLRIWARKHRPEDAAKLPGNLRQWYVEVGIKTYSGEQKQPKMNVAQEVGVTLDQAADAVGKMMKTMNNTAKHITAQLTQLPVCGVKSRCRKDAKFEVCPVKSADGGFMAFVWRDLITHDQRELIMSAEEWRQFVDEIPQALKQLGL